MNIELYLRFSVEDLDDADNERLQNVLAGTLEERREELKDCLEGEESVWHAKKTIDRQELVKWLTAEQAIPCTLHLCMRVTEKAFWSMLAQALDRYQEGDSKARTATVLAAEEHMNGVVLGTAKHKGQWMLPLKDNKGGGQTVDPRNMTGRKAEKCLMGLKSLATVIFGPSFDEASLNPQQTRANNQSKLDQWHGISDSIIPLLQSINSHEDKSPAEIDEYHILANTFMDRYDISGSMLLKLNCVSLCSLHSQVGGRFGWPGDHQLHSYHGCTYGLLV